jgi:prepilin-type N-terminal cleavage/methylation domain-containing protein
MKLGNARRRFTLIEMLVVIAVIAILGSISLNVMSSVRRRAEMTRTQNLIERLKQAIDTYSNDFGDFPSSRARKVGLSSNGVNDGVECLVRCLSTTRKNGPYLDFEDSFELGNLDGDETASDGTGSSFAVARLHEVLDSWGRPLVYLHNSDYTRGQKVSLPQDDGKMNNVLVKGRVSDETGQYFSLTSFQIMSAGPDGVFESGDGDDITSWK